MQTNNLIKLMAGMDEEYILNAIYMLRNENPEYHEKIINLLIEEYDEFSQSCEGDTDSAATCIHRIPETVNTVTSSTSSRLCFSIKEKILGCTDEKS